MTHKPKNMASAVDSQRLAGALKDKFLGYGGEDRARRLRINAARVSSTAKEILSMFGPGDQVPEAEREFLREVAAFFDGLNTMFKVQQGSAKIARAKAEAQWRAQHEVEVSRAILETFGEPPVPEEVFRCGEMLMAFASDANAQAQAKRLGVDRWHFFISRMYEFRAAFTAANADALAREIALVKMDAGARGRYWRDGEVSCYSAGWDDFKWRESVG